MDVWKDIQPLLRNPKVGFPAAMLFGLAWEAAGGKPCERFTLTTKWLARRLGRHRASVLAQVKKLHAIHDLFYVRARDRDGRYQVDIYRPHPGHATAAPDPQLLLPGFAEFGIIDSAAEATAADRDSQGSVGQGSEAPALGGEQNCPAASDGAAPQARRGDNPPGTADPAGSSRASVEIHAGGNSPRHAESRGEFPPVQAEARGEFPPVSDASGHRGEFPPVQKPPISREKEACGNSRQQTPQGEFPPVQAEARGEFPPVSPKSTGGIPPGENAAADALYSRAHAPASLESSKEDSSSPKVSNDLKNQRNPKTCARGPAGSDDAAIQAGIERRRAETERRADAPVRNVVRMVSPAEALIAARTAQATKERLVIRLRGLVNDADCREWLFGFAADLWIVYGQSNREDAGLIFGRMEATVQELADLRQVQTRNGQTHWPRGKWFNKRVCGLAAECGIDLPSQRKAKRLAALAAEPAGQDAAT